MSSVPQNVIKHKVGLLSLAAELGNVSRACKVMGFSRVTFWLRRDLESFKKRLTALERHVAQAERFPLFQR